MEIFQIWLVLKVNLDECFSLVKEQVFNIYKINNSETNYPNLQF